MDSRKIFMRYVCILRGQIQKDLINLKEEDEVTAANKDE